MNEAVEALPRSVTQHEPPPSLKASLMEVVNAEAADTRPARERAAAGLSPPASRAGDRVGGRGVPDRWAASPATACRSSEATRAGRTLQAQVDMNRLPDGSASLSVPEDDDGGSVLRVEGMPDPGARPRLPGVGRA